MAWSSAASGSAGPISAASLLKRSASSMRAIERARVASQCFLAQHHENTFLRRSRPRAAAFLHLDRVLGVRLTSVTRLRTPLRRPGRVARLARLEPAVLRRLAVADLVAVVAAPFDPWSYAWAGILTRFDGRSTAGTAANGCPVSACSAVPPVSRCQRSMLTSTKIGSSSHHTGAAAGPLRRDQGRPAPPKGSRIRPPRLEQSRIASAIIATGLTVGCKASLLLAAPLVRSG